MKKRFGLGRIAYEGAVLFLLLGMVFTWRGLEMRKDAAYKRVINASIPKEEKEDTDKKATPEQKEKYLKILKLIEREDVNTKNLVVRRGKNVFFEREVMALIGEKYFVMVDEKEKNFVCISNVGAKKKKFKHNEKKLNEAVNEVFSKVYVKDRSVYTQKSLERTSDKIYKVEYVTEKEDKRLVIYFSPKTKEITQIEIYIC